MIRILLLDDDAFFVRMLANSLQNSEEMECDVTSTTTVHAARQAVRDAAQPFDVFLIDQRLGPGPDGIEVLEELRRISPESEGIIFTGNDNTDVGLRAYRAGAHRYLHKPIDPQELIWILRSLRQWRDTQYERNWLTVLTDVTAQAQRALSVQAVAEIVVQGGRRLGFERARLWLLSEDRQTLIGVSEAGNDGLQHFKGFRTSLAKSPVIRRTLQSREPQFLQGHELANGPLDQHFGQLGFQPPVGELAALPLLSEVHCPAVLMLDNASQPRPVRPEQRRLLRLFCSQVEAALERAWLHEEEMANSRRLAVLHRTSEEIMKLAEEREEWLWHATLNAATAPYALGLGRAALFMLEEGGMRLRGQLCRSTYSVDHAYEQQEQLSDQQRDFERYLHQLRAGQLHPTPVESVVRGWILDLHKDKGALRETIRTRQMVLVGADQAAQRLPAALLARFGVTAYALLPLHAGSKVLGLVVVDNLTTGQPLRPSTLDYLKTLLAQAALTSENLRQRRSRDKLIDLNYSVMAEIGQRPMQATLTEVCQAAQTVIGADCVLLYPFRPNREPYTYEPDTVAHVGLEHDLLLQDTFEQQGVTDHILRSGTLVVDNVTTHQSSYAGRQLADHEFVRRERLRALIGIAVRDVSTREVLGMLFLDYRSPQIFTEQDKRQADSFASLAAVAIRNGRLAEEMREETAAATEQTRAREEELTILRRVLEEALVVDTDKHKVVRALLNAARELLKQPDINIKLLLREWDTLEHPQQAAREVRWDYTLCPNDRLWPVSVPEIYGGLGGRALATGEVQRLADAHALGDTNTPGDHPLTPQVRAKLHVPIKLGHQVTIGVFSATSTRPHAFGAAEEHTLERLTAVAGLALDHVRRQEHLHNVLEAVKAVTAPTNLRETLDAVLVAARRVAPGLSALTIWYTEPESSRIVLGSFFGVRDEQAMPRENGATSCVVTRTMLRSQPIWASPAPAEPLLAGRFVTAEQIESAAAFPLGADGETIGAIFFNYRQPHAFTSEERALFPILAEIAATSVRDAARMEAKDKAQLRLQAALEISEAVGTSLDLDHTLRNILLTLRTLFPNATPFVLTYDEAGRALEFTAASLEFYHADNPQHEWLNSAPLDGPSIACALARQSLTGKQVACENVRDVTTNPHYLGLIKRTRSELCLTLMSETRLLGVIALESPQLNDFDDDDEALMRSVGQQVSLAIERVKRNAQLRFKTTVAATTAWAAEVAHDINREVGYIRNRVYWLQDEQALSAEGYTFAQEIDASADRLSGTLKEARAWDMHDPELIEIDTWLQTQVQHMVSARSAQVKAAFDTHCAGVRVRAHPIALKSVLRHLVRNALAVMPSAGNLILRTQLVRGQHMVEVQIEDSGPGVPAHLRQLLFQEPATNRRVPGGFGLLYVRFTLEEMGGTVRLLPAEPGHGAVFAFTLPVAG